MRNTTERSVTLKRPSASHTLMLAPGDGAVAIDEALLFPVAATGRGAVVHAGLRDDRAVQVGALVSTRSQPSDHKAATSASETTS